MEQDPLTRVRAGDDETVSETPAIPSDVWQVQIADGGEPRQWTLSEGQSLTLGASSRAELRVDDLAVSASHGAIGVRDGQLWLRDAGSRNGIYVAGARVEQATFDREGCFVVGRTLLVVCPGAELEEEHELRDIEPLPGVIGRSPAMLKLARDVRRFADLRAPVLIRGETGAGKELVAQSLHQLSARSRGPFVPLNMGALQGELADSELFGHERGAFTGAVQSHAGAFETAQGGTIFLDEVAEIAMPTQVKLLRTLENGEVRPVGAAQTRTVDARVVSASWASLPERVSLGAFREDLFHRLAILTIDVPPLRERYGDLGPLCRGLLAAMALDIGEKHLTSGALSRLAAHRWPGNVRELKNVLLRAAVLAPCRVISTVHINQALSPFRQNSPDNRSREARRVLDAHRGNASEAARSMGVARSTFRDWLRKTDG